MSSEELHCRAAVEIGATVALILLFSACSTGPPDADQGGSNPTHEETDTDVVASPSGGGSDGGPTAHHATPPQPPSGDLHPHNADVEPAPGDPVEPSCPEDEERDAEARKRWNHDFRVVDASIQGPGIRLNEEDLPETLSTSWTFGRPAMSIFARTYDRPDNYGFGIMLETCEPELLSMRSVTLTLPRFKPGGGTSSTRFVLAQELGFLSLDSGEAREGHDVSETFGIRVSHKPHGQYSITIEHVPGSRLDTNIESATVSLSPAPVEPPWLTFDIEFDVNTVDGAARGFISLERL